MSGSVKLALTLLAAVFAIYVVYHLAIFVVAKVIGLLIPLLLIGGVVLALMYVINRKAIGPGSRRILP